MGQKQVVYVQPLPEKTLKCRYRFIQRKLKNSHVQSINLKENSKDKSINSKLMIASYKMIWQK